jgi:hypothetical protein
MASTKPLEECDVRDKERLAVYRYFRRKWIEMLNGDDAHAIASQMSALLSRDLEFRTIIHARDLCKGDSLPQNGMVHNFIDLGFFANQSLAIRRLTEPYNGAREKAVYSLPRLISEIGEQRGVITRELYVCVDGDPYDFKDGTMHTVCRHRTFDELSGVAPDARTRDDKISADVFNGLRARLKSSDVFRTYTNKALAHAADPATRREKVGFSLQDLDNAYQDLAWVTNQLSARVLYDAGHKFLPCFVCNVLEHIDNPICPPSKVEELRQYWSTRQKEIEQIENDGRC